VVQLHDPVVRARIDGEGLPLGAAVRVRLVEASPAERSVRFELASPPVAAAVAGSPPGAAPA
jgi:hypothetical protein